MEKPHKLASGVTKKRKRKAKTTASEPKTPKLDHPKPNEVTAEKVVQKPTICEGVNTKEIGDQFPIFKDENLVKRFLSVSMTNNQKGRIRQMLKDNLKGTSPLILPEVINLRIQSILKATSNLTDADLRKLRILYNMLKTATKEPKAAKKESSVKPKLPVTPKEISSAEEKGNKVKGPKRYVVFLGNLPLEVDKEKILKHFDELGDRVQDVRVPAVEEGKKARIAYLELKDEPSFEIALSRHHSMMGTRRINVLYTTQQKTKITKAEAKGKSAKLVALQKSGKLSGSTPLHRKRSQRRKKLKEAMAKTAD